METAVDPLLPSRQMQALPAAKSEIQDCNSHSKAVRAIPTAQYVQRDIDMMLWSFRLQGIRRYYYQRFWEDESKAAEHAGMIEGSPRLETVAEHCWHVADTIALIGPHFPDLDLLRCITMAIFHDKMEISTGDRNPLGRDGTGKSAHVFNPLKRLSKDAAEREATRRYIGLLPDVTAKFQTPIFAELQQGKTPEARFVKAIDKLQSLAFVLLKKKGDFADTHLRFTLRYSAKSVEFFPALQPYYLELRGRLVRQVARRRGVTPAVLLAEIGDSQLTLPL